jgi:phospholipase/carboxylesterase
MTQGRPYYLIRPHVTGEGRATVLLLHGRGADELDLLPLLEGWGESFDLVTVRAPHPLRPGYAWYDLKALGEPEPESFRQGLAYLEAVLQELPRRWPGLGRPLLLIGFSQGALMAVAAAGSMEVPALRGVAALSGYLPEGLPLPRPDRLAGLPIFWGHGRQDPVLPYAWGEAASDRLKGLKASVEFHAYQMGHAVIPEEVDHLRAWVAKLFPDDQRV